MIYGIFICCGAIFLLLLPLTFFTITMDGKIFKCDFGAERTIYY